MSLQDELRDAKQSAKTHEAICQSLIAENKKYRLTLQYIADDSETQGHPEYIGMNRLASYAKETLSGSAWLDEFEKDERIAKLESALQRIASIDQDYDAKLVGHYLLKKKCKIIAKEALEI